MKIETIQLLLNLNFKNIEQLDVKQLNTKSMMNAIAQDHALLFIFIPFMPQDSIAENC